MKIIKTYNWNRRDFCFDAECQHCGHKETNHYGYDDSNYYQNVVPNMNCSKCGESAISKPLDEPIEIRATKYDPNITI